jgi:type IV secretion system protein VirB9
MRKIFVLTCIIVVLKNESAFAAIPKPAPRPSLETRDTRETSRPEPYRELEKLREQYPNLMIPASPDIRWITPTGNGAEADIQKALENNSVLFSPNPYQVARYEDEEEYESKSKTSPRISSQTEEADPSDQEVRDARLAQYWLDVKEDLQLREIDNKAMELVQEFSEAKNAVPPVQGQNGALNYNYGDHIPKIVCRPNRITDIALQPGEKVTAVHAGDTARWQVNPAKSGAGEAETVHVIIKPLAPDISTNLLVITDRRTYNLDLVSSNREFIPSVRFSYPDDAIRNWNAFIAENRAKRQNELVLAEGANLSPDDLYFGYEIVKGKEVPWKPVRIFDDGSKTYIEMPSKYRSMEAPVLLFYEGQQQKLVNYRVKDRFYIVDRIMTKKAVLIAGKTSVVIERRKESREKASAGK